MPAELSASALTALLIILVMFHVALFITGIFYRKIHPLYLLATIFIFLAPISSSMEIPGAQLAKWARVYVAFLMVVLGLFAFRPPRTGLASKMLAGFAVLFISAALWSGQPIGGLMFKGLFGVTVMAGMFLAYGARDHNELVRGIRLLAIVAGIAGLIAFGVFLSDPSGTLHMGRLHVLGVRPNRIGQTAAPLLILCSYLAFFDPSKLWKGFGYLVAGLLAVILLYTGSRAAVGTAVVGCFVVAIPLIKRPIRAAIITAVVATFAWLAVANIQTEGVERLVDLVTGTQGTAEVVDSRMHIWEEALRTFRKHPLVGCGWVYSLAGNHYSSANLHNMYLQVLAETGLLGAVLFCSSFVFAVVRGGRVYASLSRYATISTIATLPLGLLAALLIHGLGESGTLFGATLNAMFLGFSVGLIDHLVPLARVEMARTSVPVVIQHPITPRFPRRGHGGTEVAT